MDRLFDIIKVKRTMRSMTQKDLAERAGIGLNTLIKIERGEGNPTLSVLRKIYDILGLELVAIDKNMQTGRMMKQTFEESGDKSVHYPYVSLMPTNPKMNVQSERMTMDMVRGFSFPEYIEFEKILGTKDAAERVRLVDEFLQKKGWTEEQRQSYILDNDYFNVL